MRKVILFWLALSALLLTESTLAAQVSRIGVMSFQSKGDTLAQWQPTARELTQRLPQYSFEIVPLAYGELDAAVADASIDFVFTNPEHYVVLRNLYHLRPMATLNNLINGQVVAHFGSVIFTRTDSGITDLQGVQGKRLAAVATNSLGGFLIAADTFRQHNVKVIDGTDVGLAFTGVPHSRVVQRVLSGQADVGIVRTGVLEQMQAQGKLAIGQLRILNPQDANDFPQLISTQQYPEWPWAAVRHTSADLAKAVTIALLQIGADSDAASTGRYQGFSTPANYSPVEELMRRLRV